MKRIERSLVIGMLAAILLTSLGVFGAELEEVRGEVLRLHLLANSDSAEDQALKLRARDAVLDSSAGLFLEADSKAGTLAVTGAHLDEMEQAAEAVIREAGKDYQVRAEIVNMYFETREYDGVILPAGHYDAVRLAIGEGAGANWWCVMFPPMCLPAAGEPLPLEERLAHLGETPQFVPKLALVEWIEELRG